MTKTVRHFVSRVYLVPSTTVKVNKFRKNTIRNWICFALKVQSAEANRHRGTTVQFTSWLTIIVFHDIKVFKSKKVRERFSFVQVEEKEHFVCCNLYVFGLHRFFASLQPRSSIVSFVFLCFKIFVQSVASVRFEFWRMTGYTALFCYTLECTTISKKLSVLIANKNRVHTYGFEVVQKADATHAFV